MKAWRMVIVGVYCFSAGFVARDWMTHRSASQVELVSNAQFTLLQEPIQFGNVMLLDGNGDCLPKAIPVWTDASLQNDDISWPQDLPIERREGYFDLIDTRVELKMD